MLYLCEPSNQTILLVSICNLNLIAQNLIWKSYNCREAFEKRIILSVDGVGKQSQK